MRKPILFLAALAGLLASAGLILQLTVRDDVAPLAFLFYATPLPLVAAGALFAAIAALLVKQRAIAFAMLAEAMRGSMLVAADSLQRPQFFQFGHRSRVNVCPVMVNGTRLTVAVVDFGANPFRSRHSDFEALGHILDTYDLDRLIVAGDFNTPPESRGFGALRKRGLRNAFEVAGNGRPETWPRLLPALTLDQIWVGPGIEVTGCRKVTTPLSDHLGVVAELRLGTGRR